MGDKKAKPHTARFIGVTHCFGAAKVSSCFSGPCAVFSTLLGQDAPSAAAFAALPSFFVFVGSKLLSKTSLLCPVRGFASLMQDQALFLTLWF